MAELLVPESHHYVVIEPDTCRLHNLSRFNILLIHIMIRQDHLMGRPRNVESICICSIGTIRDGIPPGAPDYETFLVRGGGDHGFGAAHETCLRHSDGLRTRHATGINPGVTISIAPPALVPASHTMYLITMLCSFDPPPSPPSGAKERRMEGSSLLKFFYLVTMLCLVTPVMLLRCIDE
jgi:hypothetical protein